jgi:hypothetical protein
MVGWTIVFWLDDLVWNVSATHIPIWVIEGWYTKHRGYEEWRKKR